jgi:saccharopine dehydrogenase-like NADP-dependent oxidoreductase
MDYFALGGAGRICREAVLDLVQHSGATRITIGDADDAAAREVADWLADPRVVAMRIDVHDEADAVAKREICVHETVEEIADYDFSSCEATAGPA